MPNLVQWLINFVIFTLSFTMAEAMMGSEGGLPMDVFTKSVPPGWRAGLTKYPLRRYTQLLKLWWRQTDISESSCGPAMAGRLRGAAFQLAAFLKAKRLDLSDGTVREMVGDELLAQPCTRRHMKCTRLKMQEQPYSSARCTQSMV